jgi:hypothetical protein
MLTFDNSVHSDGIVSCFIWADEPKMGAIYEWREFTQAGGLASYGTNLTDAYRVAGVYAGRILKGEKASDDAAHLATAFRRGLRDAGFIDGSCNSRDCVVPGNGDRARRDGRMGRGGKSHKRAF